MAIGRPQLSESGLLLIDKPRGITSFGVVSRLRKLTGVRRIGHAGTLDPFAEGLLPLCIGRATAAVQFMDSYDKTYRLEIRFGRATDTQDLTGETRETHVLTEAEQAGLADSDYAVVREAVAGMTGEQQQLPPMFSAIKIAGRPLYDYARQGREIERNSRNVRIDEADIEQISLDGGVLTATLRVTCSKGTYMRTLADDLGRSLGFYAHATGLVRLQCGPFSLEQAVTLDYLNNISAACTDQPQFLAALRERGLLLDVSRALADYPSIDIAPEMAERLIQGQSQIVRRSLPPSSGSKTVLYSRGSLIGVAVIEPADDDFVRIKTERVMIDLADFRQT